MKKVLSKETLLILFNIITSDRFPIFIRRAKDDDQIEKSYLALA